MITDGTFCTEHGDREPCQKTHAAAKPDACTHTPKCDWERTNCPDRCKPDACPRCGSRNKKKAGVRCYRDNWHSWHSEPPMLHDSAPDALHAAPAVESRLREEVEKAGEHASQRCTHLVGSTAGLCTDCAVSVALRLVQREREQFYAVLAAAGLPNKYHDTGMLAVGQQLIALRERAEAAETIISQQNIERERIVVEAHRNVEAAEKERDDHLRAWKVKAELLDKRNRELAEYREKWGHAAGCLCHEPCASVGNATGVLPTICGLGLKDCRDPRCSGGDRG